MPYRKVWLPAFVALLFAGLLMYGNLLAGNLGLLHNGATRFMSNGWEIASTEYIFYENAPFVKTGALKREEEVILTKHLPETTNKSVSFVSIGYMVEAFLDGQSFYSFGAAADSKDVWGVKTHLFSIPDGADGRELKLVLSTNSPRDMAVSQHVLLDDAKEIIRALLRVDLVKIIFALLYVSIGLFICIFTLVSAFFRRGDRGLFMLALIALLLGVGILFNISTVAFYAGATAVYWIVHFTNLALPLATLIFVAADGGYANNRLLMIMALLQSIFLAGWLIFSSLNIDFYIMYWHLALSVAGGASLIYTFAREFGSRRGRPEIAISVTAILLTGLINGISYFSTGNHHTMNFSIIVMAFPILVLMTGKVVISAAEREYRILNENATLRIEGELLHKNYRNNEKYMIETRQIWHDVDKHFSVISSLAGRGEYDALKRYLEQAGYDFKQTKGADLCDNRLVNAILSEKSAEAAEAGIEMSFTGNLPDNLQVQGNDLCSLLINMLDNALEACAKVPHDREKRIELSLKMKHDFLYFALSNSPALTPSMAGEEFITTKGDKAKHGYGISIMRSVARKYNGAFDITHTGDTFSVKVALKNAPPNGESIADG